VLKIGLFVLLTGVSVNAFAQSSAPSLPPQKVAVVTAVKFITAGLPKNIHERDRFLATFSGKLNEKGWATIEATLNANCAISGSGDECFSEVGREAHTSYVLKIGGEGNLEYGYNLQLELYSATTARTQKALAYCDLCNADKAAGIAAAFALNLLATATKEEQALPEFQHIAPDPLSTAKPQPQRDIVSEPVGPELHPNRDRLPWSIMGVGAVGVAYGAYALYKDGECSKISRGSVFTCDRISSRTLGIAAITGGGLLFLGGGIWKVTSSLSVSSNHIALNVRF